MVNICHIQGQTEMIKFDPTLDTLDIEVVKYVSTPTWRYSDQFTIKSNVILVSECKDSTSILNWMIKESHAYLENKVLELNQIDQKTISVFDNLNIRLKLSKNGIIEELINYQALVDSVVTRYSAIDSLKRQGVEYDSSEINIDWRLFEYYFRVTSEPLIFLNFIFPEITSYFELNNKYLDLYEEYIDTVIDNYDRLELLQIEMRNNTILVQSDRNVIEVECQFELTRDGCEELKRQLENQVNRQTIFNINEFECQRSRKIRRYLYNKNRGYVYKLYEKETLNINNEPYYYWMEINVK